jgi:hypothetical protein
LRLRFYISAIALILSLASCDRIKRKGNQVVDKAKDKIIAKKDAAVDKVIPIFDSYTPDTKYNKKRFIDFFGFAPTSDITDLYCYNDQIGIDSKFQFAFKCDPGTKDRIVKHLNLTQAAGPDNSSRGLWQSFQWWDSAKIVTLNPYWRKDDHEYYRYLWFDEEKKAAYYIDFDM